MQVWLTLSRPKKPSSLLLQGQKRNGQTDQEQTNVAPHACWGHLNFLSGSGNYGGDGIYIEAETDSLDWF